MTATSQRPSSHRLSRLTEVRRHAGVSLAVMARECGLSGSQSRLTAGLWEAGRHIPRPEVRPAFMHYLWDTLELRANPQEFRSVWSMLVEEWGWAAVTEDEWENLQGERVPVQDDAAQSAPPQGDSQEADHAEPGNTPIGYTAPGDVQATNSSTAESMQIPPARSLPRGGIKLWLLWAILGLAIVFGMLEFMQLETLGRRSDSVNQPDVAGDKQLPWQANASEGCEQRTVSDPHIAQGSDPYLELSLTTPDCHTISRQLAITTTTNAVQRFAIWLRPLQDRAVYGQITLRATDRESTIYTMSTPFMLSVGQSWHCVETALQLPSSTSLQLTAELNFAPSSQTKLALSESQILAQPGIICPLQNGILVDNSFEDDPELSFWQWLNQPCTYEHPQGKAQEGETFLRLTRQNNICTGLIQTIPIRPTLQPLHVALWTHTNGEQAARMAIRLGDPSEPEGQYQQNVRLSSTAWRCHELIYTPAAGQLYLALSFYLWGGAGSIYDIDHLQVSYADKQLCPLTALELDNGNFEDSVQPGVWEQHGDCSFGIAHDPRQAHSGNQYLFAARNSLECFSIYQDMLIPIPSGKKFTASIWLRSADRSLRSGFLTLWALGAPKEESSSMPFSRIGPVWRCIETTLRVAEPSQQMLRVEVYLDNNDGVETYFDDARLVADTTSVCPPTFAQPTPPSTKTPVPQVK